MVKKFQSTLWGSVSSVIPLHVPDLSTPAPHLSNLQLFHQAALILDATSPGKSDRMRPLLPPKPLGPLEAHVLPVEAHVPLKPLGHPEACVLPVEVHVPHKPLGPLEAHVLPAEACVPPKLQGPLGNPSSSMAGPSQAKYLLTSSHQVWLVQLDSLSMASLLTHACCIAKLSKPAIATFSTHCPALHSPDIFHLEASRLASTLLHKFPSLTGSEYDSEYKSGEESYSFDTLISTCFKKVANCIQPVQTTLPEE